MQCTAWAVAGSWWLDSSVYKRYGSKGLWRPEPLWRALNTMWPNELNWMLSIEEELMDFGQENGDRMSLDKASSGVSAGWLGQGISQSLEASHSCMIVQEGAEEGLLRSRPLEWRRWETGFRNCLDNRGWLVGRNMEAQTTLDFWSWMPLITSVPSAACLLSFNFFSSCGIGTFVLTWELRKLRCRES